MTDEELNAVREFAGDLLVRAFRGEVDMATALVEIRDLTPEALVEEAELPDDLEGDDEDFDGTNLEGSEESEVKYVPSETVDADLAAALETALK